jgi:hypothetical protein
MFSDNFERLGLSVLDDVPMKMVCKGILAYACRDVNKQVKLSPPDRLLTS